MSVSAPTHAVDDRQASDYAELDAELHRPVWETTEYHSVRAEELRHVAATNSWLANQLVWERNILNACPDSESACESETLRQLLHFREAYERNRSANRALEDFYALAEVQAALATIADSLTSLNTVTERIAELEAAQLAIPIDRSELDRQRSELNDRQIDLQLTQVQLNVKLRTHIGDVGDLPIWADDDWNFQSGRLQLPIHLDLAKQNRADLGGLQWLAQNGTPEGIAAIEKALQWTDPALGIALSGISLCSLVTPEKIDCCRFTNRRDQVRQLSEDYSRVVDEQVQMAALNVEGKQRQVVLAANRLRSWRDRHGQLVEKQKINQASFFDLQNADAKRIEAHGEFVVALIRWRAAQAKLQASEGRLGGHSLREW